MLNIIIFLLHSLQFHLPLIFISFHSDDSVTVVGAVAVSLFTNIADLGSRPDFSARSAKLKALL
jgi:hypothetical protein